MDHFNWLCWVFAWHVVSVAAVGVRSFCNGKSRTFTNWIGLVLFALICRGALPIDRNIDLLWSA